ncbi:MAG: DUF502 domain-containing protein [Chitinophagaceae bacterium]|nr:DUF502 domain-containing protein [Chitinophagaceae bacterium]
MEKIKTSRLLQYFLQGLLILGPFALTVYVIYIVFEKIDNILRPAINIPGLGFLIIIAFIIITGWLSSFFVLNRLLSFFDHILERTPGIKLLYSFLRDFFEAFAGNKKKFTQNVLANVDYADVWRVGFITQQDMLNFGMKDYVAVYLPMAYSVAGNVYIVPRQNIRLIPGISASDAMKFALSGGVSQKEENTEDSNQPDQN